MSVSALDTPMMRQYLAIKAKLAQAQIAKTNAEAVAIQKGTKPSKSE